MESSRKLPSIEAVEAALHAAVEACLTRHVRPDDSLAVGLSGGIDSVVLLHVLSRQPRRRLSAVHVNHQINSAADNWEAYCREYAVQFGIPFTSATVAVERGSADGLEAAARRARHRVFAGMEADWIVLAHHRDDQAETLLFNLLRGAGVAGAAGMRERNGRLLRPFLSISREQIRAYAERHQLSWCEDASNTDLRFSRNFLRQRIIPELQQRFPAASENLAEAAARFAEAKNLLDALARNDLGDGMESFPISLALLASLDEERARNVLRYLLSAQHVQIPSAARLREALRQVLEAGPDRHPAISLGSHRLVRRKGWIYLDPPAGEPDKS